MFNSNNSGWFYPALYFFLLPFHPYYFVPLIIMALIAIFHFYKRGFKNYFPTGDKALIFLITVFGLIWFPMLISLPDAIDIKHSFKTTIGTLPYFLVGLYLFYVFAYKENFKKIEVAIVVITTIWCIDALTQFFFGANIFGNRSMLGSHLSGVFYPKHTLGLVLAILLPVVLGYLYRLPPGYKQNFMASILIILNVSVISLSGSRTGFLMMLITFAGWFGYLVYFHTNLKWKKIIICTMIIATVLLVILINQKNSRLDSIYIAITGDMETMDRVSSGRLPLWEAAGKIFLDHWFNGIGPRGFRYAYNDYRPASGKYEIEYPDGGSTHPHFVLLEIAAETGIIGLICILILIYLLYDRLMKLDSESRLLVFPWFFAVTIGIVPNIAKAFYSSFWISILLIMLFIGIANIRNLNHK